MPYRPCVGIMLINQEGLVWTGRRSSLAGAPPLAQPWQMPQGGIDENETPLEAAFRELKEETGTNEAQVLAETPEWLYYDLPDESLGWALKGKYRGQKQKWFAMDYQGQDEVFNLGTGNKAEFDQWAWRPAQELIHMVASFKREVYEQVVAEFASLLQQRN